MKKLDVISNHILKDTLRESGYVKAISSEEEDDVVPCNPDGNYLVSFDPLDGSSNTEINSLIHYFLYYPCASVDETR